LTWLEANLATSTVSNSLAFLVFPTLNSTFTWRVAAVSTNRTISRHKNLELAVEKGERLNVVALLHDAVAAVRFVDSRNCSYEHPHYEYPCGDPASVTDLDSRRPLCAKHFRMVALDAALDALEVVCG
jgi:hypothetical protein